MQQHTYPASRQNSALRVSLFFYIPMESSRELLLTFEEQINLLKKRGLLFPNEEKARHILQHVSYFRLKSYMTPLMINKADNLFYSNTSFESVYKLYKFDSKLRKLVASELEKIEVSIRTQMAYIIAEEHGAFWFADSNNFVDNIKFNNLFRSITEELNRCDDEFITKFSENVMPPAWMVMEITSFGTLSMLYKYLKPGYTKRKIAQYYGVSDSVFESWLHSIVYVRNICAHHSRLWNRVLRVRPLYPKKTAKHFIENTASSNRIYFVLSIIQYLLQTINPKTSFPQKIRDLFIEFPEINSKAMGFPNNWESEFLWRIK